MEIKLYRYTVLSVLLGILLVSIFEFTVPHCDGDGLEYILMTEAFANHGTPNIKPADVQTLKRKTSIYQKWETLENYQFFENVGEFTSKQVKLLDSRLGIYANQNNVFYSYHFWFYSLINLPAKFVLNAEAINPLYCFSVTNSLLIILCCWVILFHSPFKESTNLAFVMLFFFSHVYWYVTWAHPEVYTACMLFLGMWFYFQNKYTKAILFIALAALQNQPLLLLLGFVTLHSIIDSKFKPKVILSSGLLACIAIIPPLFYYFNYHVTNLIAYEGFLDTKNITFTRVFGFFFDLNQGMVLGFPLILFLYLFLYIKKVISMIRSRSFSDIKMLLPLIVVATAASVATMTNWNGGEAVVNRYASWLYIPILVHFYYLIAELVYRKWLINISIITQIYSVYHMGGMEIPAYEYTMYKKFAAWVTEHYPNLYNPDPTIFAFRVAQRMSSPDNSPIIYATQNKEVKKIMIYRDQVKDFLTQIVHDPLWSNRMDNLTYVNGWTYLNDRELCSKVSWNIVDSINQVRYNMDQIKFHPEWYDRTAKKAALRNIPVDEMIKLDAIYLYVINKKKAN